ncbi:MAG: 50S ribosomal protein L11 methyltransferase [Sphingobacteriales bacterium]|nr:MAG: 50S ribosomal protein L11 methyltransferase [Sphingobacteriales bacterium]TAF78228.1 MAG: 50S ribosomal protein L11 methyltransferase [Sphingobacteriales bacterium]
MNYYELVFTLIDSQGFYQDLLINDLSQISFDTFEETDFGFKAYIVTDKFDQDLLDNYLLKYAGECTFSYEINLIPAQNWNQVWESNFEPITINDKVLVRATFHPTKNNFDYEIVIDPKMAFGTGHHQTTAMMMAYMLETNFTQKMVLDMGCGTGILAILASKMGAKQVIAIDNDPVCYQSVIENAALNGVKIESLCGSKEEIPTRKFDIILANINRNILLDQIATYAQVLNNDGILFLSGFHQEPDVEMLNKAAKALNLKYLHHKNLNEWVAAKFVKIN